MHKRWIWAFLISLCGGAMAYAGDVQQLKCTDHPARSWWDVQHYTISVTLDTATGFVKGSVQIRATVLPAALDELQIDLQAPMRILSIHEERVIDSSGTAVGQSSSAEDGASKNALPKTERSELDFSAVDAGVYLVRRKPGEVPFSKLLPGSEILFTVYFEGLPKAAANPPWDGGIVLSRDASGHRWMAIACQGIGASVWLPLKDHPADEPDKGIDMYLTVPSGVPAISNGKLIQKTSDKLNHDTWHWKVSNPINNYNITFYIGNYVHLQDTFSGQGGLLKLDYYVLPGQQQEAEKQFQQVKTMLSCFEAHFGSYPFYEDGYKVVASPYLGMEHQSAIAYGNQFENGYLGKDRSGSGVGLLFDFILIHESAHEWFGNSISVADKADTWVQEGFTTYAETVYAEWIAGKDAALAYQRGKKALIQNDRPVQGQRGACDGGSLDHYDKAAFMLHMIRVLIADDSVFFSLLRDVNRRFFHQIVTGSQIETFLLDYLDTARYNADVRFTQTFFDQYLREANLPVLQLQKVDDRWLYRWSAGVPGFDMPVIWQKGDLRHYLYPSAVFKELPSTTGFAPEYILEDFLIEVNVE